MNVALALENVSARYGEHVVLHDASAAFVGGRVTGVVGPNGAGKTTLLRVALGLVAVDSGSVQILGRDLRECSREFLARSIAYLPQVGAAQWPVPVRRVVALGRMPHTSFFAPQDHGGDAAVAEALDRCDVAQFAARRLDELSAGERARVLLARALATQAKVLLVDEPAAHLDPAHQLRLMELLRGEALRGVAIGITLHDLSLASRYCDDIAVLHDGRVIGQGAPREVLSDAALATVFGIAAIRAAGPGADAIVPWSRL
jgi:iron complex transport system ATP-binding protein